MIMRIKWNQFETENRFWPISIRYTFRLILRILYKISDTNIMEYLKAFGHYIVHSLFMSAVISLSMTVVAEELHKVDAEALEKTVQLLNSSAQRQEVIENSDQAKRSDDMVRKMMGGNEQNVDETYKVAAEIFRGLAKDNNGNLQDIMQAVGQAQQNPEGFYKTLSPEQQAMIKALGEKAEAQKKLNNQQ